MERQTTEVLESLYEQAMQIDRAWQALIECRAENFETKQAFWQAYERAVMEFRRKYEDHAERLLLAESLDISKLIKAFVEFGELNPGALIALSKTMDPCCIFERPIKP